MSDLRGLILVWHPIEQFLTLTGRTYFKGLTFADLHRLQFDLETTGLNEDRDRIFMVSMRDSSGWKESLDTASLSEARLIERFVELVRAELQSLVAEPSAIEESASDEQPGYRFEPIPAIAGYVPRPGLTRAIITHCGSGIVSAHAASATIIAGIGKERGLDARLAYDGMKLRL